MVLGPPCPWWPKPKDPMKHSRLFLAPEVVDSKGDCNKDQEHGHSDKALHPGLQVPHAWKEGSEGVLQQSEPQWDCKCTARAGGQTMPRAGACVRGHQPPAKTRGDILGQQGWEGGSI